jgi:hypothetical protein
VLKGRIFAELARLNWMDCVLPSDQHQQFEEQRLAEEVASLISGFYMTERLIIDGNFAMT